MLSTLVKEALVVGRMSTSLSSWPTDGVGDGTGVVVGTGVAVLVGAGIAVAVGVAVGGGGTTTTRVAVGTGVAVGGAGVALARLCGAGGAFRCSYASVARAAIKRNTTSTARARPCPVGCLIGLVAGGVSARSTSAFIAAALW
jgi:hypothetical protein